jgi:PAS domain S-box-containing protein
MFDRLLRFGLTAETELSFRRAHLRTDVARVRPALLLVAVAIVAFAASDRAVLGMTSKLFLLVAIRVVFAGWTLGLRAALKRIERAEVYDRLCFAWGLSLIALFAVVNTLRPQAYVSHLVVAMASVFCFTIVLPIRFSHQMVLCLGMAASELATHLLVFPDRSPGAPISLLVMSGFALEGGWQLHAHRRREFLAREALRTANERLEVEVADRTRRLWQAVDELDRFFSLSPDLLCIMDLEGRFRRVNHAWELDLGYPAASLEGRPLVELVHPDDVPASRDALLSAGRSADPVSFSNRFRAADGSYRWFDWHAASAASAIHAVGRDATERRRIEEQLRETEKLEAVGRLAGGVAHNFNNQLTAILGSSELLLEESSGEAPVRQEATEIRDAARRAATLTRQLLTFGRRQLVRPRVLDLCALVTGMEEGLRRMAGAAVAIETRAAPAAAYVRADPAELRQVIEILVANACDAMPGGGRIIVETSHLHLAEPEVGARLGLEGGRYVRLTVADTGSGMTPEVQAHLFEPFFTTKGVGMGTGLGLSTVYGVVKQAGGEVRVRSEPGNGTTFDVYLPAARDREEPRRVPELPAAKGTERVLLVEDEPMVRGLMARTLRGLGYQVLEAADGKEGLRVATELAGDLDLVVTDVVMPRMTGRELVEQVRRVRPDVEVLFISGYPDDENAPSRPRPSIEPGAAFLQKPFVMAELARTVRALLDARGTVAAGSAS